MNRGQLTFPFKRYQIQPVWRADRPQKGRYREFFQCDADVIGSDSLLFEAELALIYDEAFAKLGVPVKIKLNNRKILFGIAEAAGIPDQFMTMTVAIDKLDKVGIEGVRKELSERGISEEAIARIEQILENGTLEYLHTAFADSPTGKIGLAELERVFDLLKKTLVRNEIAFDITLARGLSYYTGCIFEVSAIGYQIGSIGGGGRYADLTGVFGVSGLSGVGISFGADRIYDVMEGLNLFPETLDASIQVLIASFDEATHDYGFQCVMQLRAAGIAAELYPEYGKLKKQFEYAAKRNVPFVAIAGENELAEGVLSVKNQKSGEQESYTIAGLIGLVQAQ
jgi:histidyl-tRNA synthetase